MRTRQAVPVFGSARVWLLVIALTGVPACVQGGGVDMSPNYERPQFVVPDDWQGASPFTVAHPNDDALRANWWTYFNDPVLNELEEQAMAANPDIEAAAERFVQARDAMMMVRSRLVPQIGLGVGISGNRQSDQRLFRNGGPNEDGSLSLAGLASWEPDFWDEIRNTARMRIYAAQERAALYGLARLSIQAELAAAYFTLRGLDAKNAIYTQTIDYYQRTLDVVSLRLQGQLASQLDVARARFLLSSTQAEMLAVQSEREVTEHAIAMLVNRAAPGFSIPPVETLVLPEMQVPSQVPSTLLERRPDIAAMERRMAQANRAIGIARAAFFPRINVPGILGLEGNPTSFWQLGNGFWSYGSLINLPIFQGGMRRAQLQRTWSAYRETEDRYRSTVLNAFREVSNSLTRTRYFAQELERRNAATSAAQATQQLSMELFQGGLASSLELIYSQVNTLQSRLAAVDITANLLKSIVELIRSMGGGWSRRQLPNDDEVQPFGVFQYWDLDRPSAAGGIDIDLDRQHRDLTQPPPGQQGQQGQQNQQGQGQN